LPAIGAIFVYVFKFKEKRAYNQEQLANDKNFKKEKAFLPSSFTIIFVLIIVVILII